jgi:hypothetical protein
MLRVILNGLTQPYVSVTCPRDWWQAVKYRWLPQWILRRWPARNVTWEAKRFCPHIVPEREPHVDFLLGARGQKPERTEHS